ncbi:hypothetical protein KW791_00670 [Candidatus Parcubacteria bacterium]|nr:hypothetical protein [Candidatus Parcubacteria bacterium]
MRIEELEHRLVKKALRILYRTACAEQFLSDPRICSDKMRDIEAIEDWYLKDPVKEALRAAR